MHSSISVKVASAPMAHRLRPVIARRTVVTNAFSVRPYTVRRGDTLTSIASKRGFDVAEVIRLNHELDPDNLKEGQTLLLPAGALSERDREIIKGMDRGKYRTYPVRKGEKLSDILDKRSITMAEFVKLNPEIDPERLGPDVIIKLPTNKFTVREREMLTGSGILPAEFFSPANAGTFAAGIAVGGAAFAAVSFAMRTKKDDDEGTTDDADRL